MWRDFPLYQEDRKMITPRKMKFFGLKDIDNIPQLKKLSDKEIFALKVVSNVLPFRTNNYVIKNPFR